MKPLANTPLRRLVIKLELSRRDEYRILQNSIERVVNTSLDVAGAVANRDTPTDYLIEIAGVNYEDWEELKPLTVLLWEAVRNAIFLSREQEQKTTK